MCKKRDDPYFFQALFCEDCGTKEDLYVHKYLDTVKCVDCVNKLIEEIKENE